MTPGSHPRHVRINTRIMATIPLSMTARGGKKMQNRMRNQVGMDEKSSFRIGNSKEASSIYVLKRASYEQI